MFCYHCGRFKQILYFTRRKQRYNKIIIIIRFIFNRKLKEERKREQEANVKRKSEEKERHKEKSLEG